MNSPNKGIVHLDLFSGIGGAALAVEAVWPDAEHIFVEKDPYCQALLKLRFPNSTIHGDIRTFTSDTDGWTSRSRYESKSMEATHPQLGAKNRIDLLTGGFPCQPFSQAGRRKGTSDDRFLWPEMLRVIREFKPRWIVGENVAGLLTIEQGVVFKQILADLEGEGYEIESFVIPAVAVNAPHRRDRVWIVANRRRERGQAGNEQGMETDESKRTARAIDTKRQSEDDSHAERAGLEGGEPESEQGASGRPSTQGSGLSQEWNRNWLEVATELCRMDDGLPAELDGLKLSKSKHRAERLKGLGNAWVPQVAIEIMKGIKAIKTP